MWSQRRQVRLDRFQGSYITRRALMASPESLKILRELQSRPDNKICCDCSSKNPQWASVSYGCFMYVAELAVQHGLLLRLVYTFRPAMSRVPCPVSRVPSLLFDARVGIARAHGGRVALASRAAHAHLTAVPLTVRCLECSGKHRGLGVHISFVRSVTMDAWNEIQLKKMQLGGNAKMNDFFAKYGVPKAAGIVDKYNSPAAEIYREVIKAGAEGRSYTPPDPKSVAARKAPVSGIQRAPQSHHSGSSSLGGANAGSIDQSSGNYRLEDLQRSAQDKGDFFAQKQRENAMRPDHLPPSQGGKYVGFGSTPAPGPQGQRQSDIDVGSILNKGLSELSVLATKTASVARSKATEMNDALQDAGVAEKTKEYGAKGWNLLRSAYANAASAVEKTAAQQGYQLDLGSRKVADGVEMGGGGGRYMGIDNPPPSGHGFEHVVDTRTKLGGGVQQSGVQRAPRQHQQMTPPAVQQQADLLDFGGKSDKSDIDSRLDGDFQDDGWADWGSEPTAPKGSANATASKQSATNRTVPATTATKSVAPQDDDGGWAGWDADLGAQETTHRLSAEHEGSDWGEW